jgi:hypothetical protein
MIHFPTSRITLILTFLSVFAFCGALFAQTGTLTGNVYSCYTGTPIPGATVTCGSNVATTNATGNYLIANIPAGNYTVTATAVGYTAGSFPCTIISNQVTTLDMCINPVCAYLTGVITNCVTGDPVVGARIALSPGNIITYSTAGGAYSIPVFPGGIYLATFTMTGFDNLVAGPFSLTPPNITTFNVQLKPALGAPANVTAVLDAGQTAADITWNTAGGPSELIYDDGIPEQCFQSMASGSVSAVRFTPCGYPALIQNCNIYVCGTPANLVPFDVYIYQDDGPGGMPGTVLGGPYTVTPTTEGWETLILPSPITLTGGSFFVAMELAGTYPNLSGISVDTTVNQLRSFQKTGAGPWVPAGGNNMIRAVVNQPCGNVPPSAITYTVYRMHQGEEATPANWVTVGTVTGANTINDPAWSTLPCGPYQWAVQAAYPCNGNTVPGFSNVIGKCWTAEVTIHGLKCCPSWEQYPMTITAQNINYPDTVYTVFTDSTEYAVIHNLWKGNYHITASCFGCSTYNLILAVTADTLLDVVLTTGVTPPATYLSIDPQTLLATWNAPGLSQPFFEESWTSGTINPAVWTISGGTNWQMASGFGNPAPSIMFNYLPQVNGYDQYLTSKVIPATFAPFLHLEYDIYLDNYGTTTLNTMSVEVWDGTSWNVLQTYTNAYGNIPWTTDWLDLTTYAGQAFQFRFHASGGDSYDINNWNIDNIRVIGNSNVTCLIGYNVSLNGTLGAFTPDTSYQIPPEQVVFGQSNTLCVTAVYGYNIPGYSIPICKTFTSGFLYPVNNFIGDSLECNALISWTKPETAFGATPPGLVGYNLYRDYTMIHYCPSPDSLSYVDQNLDPGSYYYYCSAKYDLTVYGFPGQFGESVVDNAQDWVDIACGTPIPFLEGFNQGNFSFGDWTFDPSQGNWNISSGIGNPAPAADFSWSGKSKSTGYSYAMVSRAINGTQWECAHLFLSFDIKLEDRFLTSTEMMTIEILYDNTWHQLGEYVNNGSFGWAAETFGIDAARGKAFMIRFRAHGDDSYNILHWYIDNISIYGNCLQPEGLDIDATSENITLNWNTPCANISGYNIFRSDSTGNPPFTLLTPVPVTATTYIDVPAGWSQEDTYQYFVTAQQTDTTTLSLLCESAGSDTVTAAFPVAIAERGSTNIRIYPNPAGDYVIIQGDIPITRIKMISGPGTTVFDGKYSDSSKITLNIASFSPGIYILELTTGEGKVYRKIVKL